MIQRNTVALCSPKLAKQVQFLGSAEIAESSPERQEQAAQDLLDILVELLVLTPEQAASAQLDNIGAAVLIVSVEASVHWLEINASTGRVQQVLWPDYTDAE